MKEVIREITALREHVAKLAQSAKISDGWLDAKGAAKYLGISAGTFDKYRYSTTPRLEGAKLDGKTLYKKEDLDLFVRLYEVKSQGLA